MRNGAVRVAEDGQQDFGKGLSLALLEKTPILPETLLGNLNASWGFQCWGRDL